MSDTESSIGPRQSLMEILGIDWGWVGNECRPDQRIGHGYDRLGGGEHCWIVIVCQSSLFMFIRLCYSL